jgi:Concanavalin A-like lectin/glucanases superfamily
VKKFLLVIIPVSLLVFNASKPVTWYLKDTRHIGAFSPVVLGNPVVKAEGKDSSIYFNGINDGLVIPAIPIEGWPVFTVEVLFKPDNDGPVAPRFIHVEDSASNRITFELRLTKNSQWYFDGFLKNGKTNKGLALIDSTKLHPANKWSWAALIYDGHKMYSYINGEKELEGEIDFPPMTKGNISLGVRLNKVNWFKGQIQEIRFHPEALEVKSLRRS